MNGLGQCDVVADEGADWGACVFVAEKQFCCEAADLVNPTPAPSKGEVSDSMFLVQGGSISGLVLGLLYSFQERLVSTAPQQHSHIRDSTDMCQQVTG